MKIVKTESLCKSYGKHQILHSVDLHVDSGKLVGFLGPNGAGKSTTIRILAGLLSISSGTAKIFGQSVVEFGKQIRHEIGYLPGDVHLYSNMTGKQLLQFFIRARRIDCMSEVDRLANVFDLDLSKNIRKFSTGMKQKLGLIQAMMHKPKLLILDEPTSALDPLVREEVFKELRNVIEEKRTVLFSSHSLSEVESLCDEVIVLRNGSVVEQQTIQELKNRALRKIQIVFSANDSPGDTPSNLKVFEFKDRNLHGTWSGSIQPLLQWIEQQSIEDVTIERPDLNDLFMSYYSDNHGANHV